MRELKARADEYGAVFTSVHPFTSAMESSLLFGNYPRRTAEAFAFYRRYCEAASYLGGKYVVILASPWPRGFERPGVLGAVRAADPLYRDTGARPAQENVRNMRASDPAFLRGMRAYLGEDCAFVLDVKQCRMMNHPVEEVARAMGDRLCHVHLSDCREGRPCLLPGAGAFDLAGFRALLEELHYQGR